MAISKLILNGEVQMDVTSDTVTAGSMLSGTTATKNDGTKATGTIASKSSSDLTVSGATVTAPAGYYSANASKSVANGSVTAPSSISGTSATVSTGTNTLTLTKSVSVTPNVTTAGYISSGTAGNASVSLTASVTTKAAATITPSTSEQSIAAGTYLTGKQTISAMPSGTAGTPTASKGTVSNHAISVTPSVTNTTGYITGGTKTGTAVSVSASELVSGTKSITENGTSIDVTNYASVDVNVSGGFVQGTFTTSSTTGAAQTINVPYAGNGYPLLAYVELTEGLDVAYNSGRNKAIGAWFASKFDKDSAARYNYDYATVFGIMGANYTGGIKNEYNFQTYYSAEIGASGIEMSNTIAFMSATQFSVWVSEAGSYGLMPETSYTYYIVYSA